MRTAGTVMLALGLALTVEPSQVRADGCEFVVRMVDRNVLRIDAPGLEQGALVKDASECAPVVRPKEGIRLDASCVGEKILKGQPSPLVLAVKAADKLGPELSACRTTANPNKVELKLRMVEASDWPVVASGKVQLSDEWNAWFDPSQRKWVALGSARTLDKVEPERLLLVMGPSGVAALHVAPAAEAPAPGGQPTREAKPTAASSANSRDVCGFTPRYKVGNRVEFDVAGLAGGGFKVKSACGLAFGQGVVSLGWDCFSRLLGRETPEPLEIGSVTDVNKLPAPLRACVVGKDSAMVLKLTPRLRSVSIPAGVVNGHAVLDHDVAKAWPWVLLEDQWVALTKPLVASELIRAGRPVYALSSERQELAILTATVSGDWCQAAPESALVCFDTTGGRNGLRWSPVRNVLQPNRGLVVRVLHARGQKVTVTVGGTRGLVESSVRGGGGLLRHNEVDANQPVVSTMVSSFTFVPRKPGPADVTIETGEDGPEKTSSVLELEVEELSWGAARFGFGALFGDVVSRTYEAQVVAGSKQLEIGVAKDSWLGWEVVIGFAPYLFDIVSCDGHGRSHTGGCNKLIAPYFGVGIVGDAPAGVTSFNALYLGAELEFAPSFSVAAAAVWRGVSTLRGGYAVHSAVEPGTQFTRSTTAFGFGLILNVTPDFLQFATGADAKATTSTATSSTQTPAPQTLPAPSTADAGAGDSTAEDLEPTDETEPAATTVPPTDGGVQ